MIAAIVQKITCICGLKNTVSTIPCVINPMIDTKQQDANIIFLVSSEFLMYSQPFTSISNKKATNEINAKIPLSTAVSR